MRRRVRPATRGHNPDHRSEEFLYELKAGPAGGRLRRPSSAGSNTAATRAPASPSGYGGRQARGASTTYSPDAHGHGLPRGGLAGQRRWLPCGSLRLHGAFTTDVLWTPTTVSDGRSPRSSAHRRPGCRGRGSPMRVRMLAGGAVLGLLVALLAPMAAFTQAETTTTHFSGTEGQCGRQPLHGRAGHAHRDSQGRHPRHRATQRQLPHDHHTGPRTSTLVPDDPSQPTYTGKNTVRVGENVNGKTSST